MAITGSIMRVRFIRLVLSVIYDEHSKFKIHLNEVRRASRDTPPAIDDGQSVSNPPSAPFGMVVTLD